MFGSSNPLPQIKVGLGLDVGRARAGRANQDSIGTCFDYLRYRSSFGEKGLLYIVADGMGGAAGGQEASQTAVRATIEGYYQDPELPIESSLIRAIQQANREIYQKSQNDPSLRGMGTTIVAVVIHGSRLVMAHAGDSRGYLLRQGTLRQLGTDHTWVQEQVNRGILTADQAERHPQRHVLSRNLGNEPEARPDLLTESLQVGDTLLLCSDGLHGVVSDEEITRILEQEREEGAANRLVELANERGGPDNIAILLLHVEQLPVEQSFPTSAPSAAAISSPLSLPPSRPAPQRAPSPTATFSAGRIILVLVTLLLLGLLAFGATRYLLPGRPLPALGEQREQAVPALPSPLPTRALSASEPTDENQPVSATSSPVPTRVATPPPSQAPPQRSTPANDNEGAESSTLFGGKADGERGYNEPAPALRTPAEGTDYAVGEPVRFEWSWTRRLAEGERFELTLFRNGRLHDVYYTNNTFHLITLDRPGEYRWELVVVQTSGGVTEEVSLPAEPGHLTLSSEGTGQEITPSKPTLP